MKVGLDASIPRFPKRFRRRVFLSITVFTALSSIAASSFYFFRQRQDVEEEMIYKGNLLANHLASRSVLGLFSGNVDYFASYVKSAAERSDVQYVTIHDLSGKEIFVHPPTEKLKRTPKPLPVEVLTRDFAETKDPWTRKEDDVIEFVLPVAVSAADGIALAFDSGNKEKKNIGWVRVAVSRKPAMIKLDEARKVSLYFSLGLLLFGILAAILITWRITGPLTHLTKSVHAIRKGNLDQRVEIRSHDELGQLGDAFNRMAWNLKETMNKLESLNKNLEEEVTKRTADIRGISEFIKVLNEPLQVKTLLNAALAAFKSLSKCCAAAVFLHSPKDNTLNLTAQIGAPPDSFGPPRTKAGEKNIGKAAESSDPIVLTDIPDSAELCLAVGKKLETAVYAPIKFGDNLEGVLTAVFDVPLEKEDLSLINQATQQLGVALSNAGAYESTNLLAKELELRNKALTEQKTLLQKQKKALIEANRLKSEFLANTTHELRTPLNAIIGYTGLIRDGVYGKISKDQEEALKGIDESAQSLLGLINQTLDYAKIESKQMPLVISEVDLTDLIHKTVSAAQGLTKDKPYKIETHLPPDPAVKHCDDGKIKQILTNLLSNAVKFTDTGKVEVSLETSPGGHAIIKVKDTGVGIAPEDQQIIFEAFRQIDGSSTRAAGGTGLGLAISKKLTILFGGKLEVNSRPGEGSVFTLTIPADPPSKNKKYMEGAAWSIDDLSAAMGVNPKETDQEDTVEGDSINRDSKKHPFPEKSHSQQDLERATIDLDLGPPKSISNVSTNHPGRHSTTQEGGDDESTEHLNLDLDFDFDPSKGPRWTK